MEQIHYHISVMVNLRRIDSHCDQDLLCFGYGKDAFSPLLAILGNVFSATLVMYVKHLLRSIPLLNHEIQDAGRVQV